MRNRAQLLYYNLMMEAESKHSQPSGLCKLKNTVNPPELRGRRWLGGTGKIAKW